MPGPDYIPPMTEEQKKIQEQFREFMNSFVYKRDDFLKYPSEVDPEEPEE